MNEKRKKTAAFLAQCTPAGIDVAVEVGVYRGELSALILQHLKPGALHLIDPWRWRRQWFDRHDADERHDLQQGEALPEGDELHDEVVARFADEPNVCIHRQTSLEAAAAFGDESVDWVFVDGDHRYSAVLADMDTWWRTLKPGGVLCGDDYRPHARDADVSNGVADAVNRFAARRDLSFTLTPLITKGPDDHNFLFSFRKPTD